MLALGAVHLNFWVDNPNDAKDIFHQHLIIIKIVYCGPHKVGKDGVLVKVLFTGNVLNLKCSYFKMTVAINNEQIMKEKSLVNLVMRLWTKISSFLILKHKLSKFMKLIEITHVQVLGFVKDE
jgi:hypothetical protein